MKIMTVLGTRPEIIRLCLIMKRLDRLCQHVFVHTGQNYDVNLSDIFLEQLELRTPDHYLGARGSFGEQIGKIFCECEKLMRAEKPDKLLILGDTNSSLAAVVAKRLAIPVYHMEAGNRCFDDRVPEEVNRRVIDHSSDVLMPYSERSRQNLLAEGIPSRRIYVTGNPIYEVIRHFQPRIEASPVLAKLALTAGNYFLVTMHREENVDVPERLNGLVSVLDRLQKKYRLPVIVSTHPRTRVRMQSAGISSDNAEIRFMEPFPFFDFITLERNAFCILTDSGTVQEECAIFKLPNVTLRDVTERPETIECGSNILSGVGPEVVERCVETVLQKQGKFNPPPEYLVENVSDTVVNILQGFLYKSL